jgi:hypothetical protein
VSEDNLEECLLQAIINGAGAMVKRTAGFVRAHPEWSVEEMEVVLRDAARCVTEAVVDALVEGRREDVERDRTCPQCGERMQNKGSQPRQCETLLGRLYYKRRYYYCTNCGKGRYPLDEAMGIGAGQLSDGCESALSRLGASLPFQPAAETFTALTGISVSGRQLARITEKRGRQLESRRADQRAAILAGQVPNDRAQGSGRWCSSLDAAKVRFMDGWHEVKAGVVFRAQSRDLSHDRVQARDLSYVVQLGSMDQAGERLYTEAIRRGVCPISDEVTCLADGAPANWTQFDLHFPKRIEGLDWYHATQHLWAAAKGVFGEGTDEARHWVTAQKDALWVGKVPSVLASLRHAATLGHGQAAQDEIHYFESNQTRMDYGTFREQGCPIGSGTVESACKQVIIARARLAGMRWSTAHLQGVLSLRAELLSRRWAQAWPLTRPAPSGP